jgi:hypothetical protein
MRPSDVLSRCSGSNLTDTKRIFPTKPLTQAKASHSQGLICYLGRRRQRVLLFSLVVAHAFRPLPLPLLTPARSVLLGRLDLCSYTAHPWSPAPAATHTTAIEDPRRVVVRARCFLVSPISTLSGFVPRTFRIQRPLLCSSDALVQTQTVSLPACCDGDAQAGPEVVLRASRLLHHPRFSALSASLHRLGAHLFPSTHIPAHVTADLRRLEIDPPRFYLAAPAPNTHREPATCRMRLVSFR